MRYYIIAGEASGDLHGSNLIRGLFAEDQKAEVRFWGGDLMLEACRGKSGILVRHYKDGAVMGFTDVLAKAGKLLGNIRFCKEDILLWKPDIVILIDYPGFNFKIASFAHKHGFKVFYYIAPKTWASREKRNRKLKKYVDKLFIVFPFEQEYFKSKGIPYEYCGNPLLDAINESPAVAESRESFFSRHSLSGRKYIAILAGSRKGEINRMMPVCMDFADRLRSEEKFKDYEFIIAGAPARSSADYQGWITGREYVKLIFNDTYAILKNAESAVINSGTASLEAALIGTPQVVGWSTSRLTAFIANKLLHVLEKIKYISLGNLIVNRQVFQEMIQDDFTSENLLNETLRLINNEEYRQKMLDGYKEIKDSLGGCGASRKVAAKMIES